MTRGVIFQSAILCNFVADEERGRTPELGAGDSQIRLKFRAELEPNINI